MWVGTNAGTGRHGATVPDERRRSPRVPLRAKVEFRTRTSKGYGQAVDIGEGGLFVRADRAALQGSTVYVEFALPGDPPATRRRAYGQVAWSSLLGAELGFGVQFLELRPADRLAIHELVARAR